VAGLLDGDIASAIYAGFKNRLLKGGLRRVSTTGTPDASGDPVPAGSVLWLCQGFTEDYDDHNRPAGIPETDLKVNIFAKSLPVNVRPRKDDTVNFVQAGATTWFQLRNATIDPAGALWTCRAYVIPAPLESE